MPVVVLLSKRAGAGEVPGQHVRGVCVAHVAKRVNMTFAKKIIIVDKAPSAGERSSLLKGSFKDVTYLFAM